MRYVFPLYPLPLPTSVLTTDYLVDIQDPKDNGYSSFALSTPTFANGTTIPSGSYRVLMRALRVTGDPAREEDYDTWLSPILGVYPE